MTTTLNCLGWMQNQNDQSPCATAQDVGQLCNAGYTVSLTNFQESNYVPNVTTTNDCTCSWSIYNLLSACSYCVGQRQYKSWSAWVTDCGSYASNTSYLPSGRSISQGIPYWAATNPSTWENATFNVTQAADIAAAAHPDVTGGPLPTSTSSVTGSSASQVSVGAIVGGVIGAIAIIIIGGLIILCAARRHRRQRMHATPTGVPYTNVSQVPVPPIRSGNPVQPSRFGYAYVPRITRLTSPVHSTTSLALTSPLASPISSGFSHGHNAAQPLSDAADMITPFLATSSARRTNRSNTSPPTGKAAEALSERVVAPPGQRSRLNPPPYSASVVPASESSEAATTRDREASTKKEKKRDGSVTSGATKHSAGHSRTSTKESVTAVHAGPRTEQSRPRAATLGKGTVESVENTTNAGGVGGDDGGDSVEMRHGERAGIMIEGQRPPAI